MRKQEWYHSYLQDEYADPIPFVGRFSNTSPIETVANDIRQTLGLNDEFRNQTRSKDHFYVRLVEQAEIAGVLVMRNSVVGNNTHRPLDPNEFQGFAMLDSLAPLVFINQKDYLSAQIFTLMHELAHIWMGISGVSVQDYLESPVSQDEITQRQANEVAAEILVPRRDFISRWRSQVDPDQGLKTLQRHYRVSIFVILRRAYELGEIPFDYYRSTYYQLRSKITSKKKGGGSGYRNLFTRNSTTITISLLNSVSEGKTLPTQASSLLNVRPAVIYNLQKYLAEM
jgi:Zn-dependent peptidase ImmA (M78 family)